MLQINLQRVSRGNFKNRLCQRCDFANVYYKELGVVMLNYFSKRSFCRKFSQCCLNHTNEPMIKTMFSCMFLILRWICALPSIWLALEALKASAMIPGSSRQMCNCYHQSASHSVDMSFSECYCMLKHLLVPFAQMYNFFIRSTCEVR